MVGTTSNMTLDLDRYTATKLNAGEVVFSYKGTISTDSINDILGRAEGYFTSSGASVRLRKKVYNILVESLQNLYHHSVDLTPELQKQYPSKYAFVYLRKLNDVYVLTTGNFVVEAKVKALSQKIDKINTLSQDDLKEMYKFILNHQKLSAKGGGGLGMIDIARKSGHKLTYEFLEFNKDYYFYLLNINITEE